MTISESCSRVPVCRIARTAANALASRTVGEIVDTVLALPDGARLRILAPRIRERKGRFDQELERLRRDGYVRVRIDGEERALDDEIRLDPTKPHTIDAVVDRLVVRPKIERRLADSLETALSLSGGMVVLDILEGPRVALFNPADLPGLRRRLCGTVPASVLVQRTVRRLSGL